ncbi:MAG: NAD(P)/FAD-dependent oxidoreductase [Arenicellales bacterium]
MTHPSIDAVVIGAGIIGTSTALALTQKGFRVLVIDALPGAGQGATSSSLAMIRTQYSTREGTALAWEGYHCWKDWPGFLGLPSDEPVAPFHLAGVLTFKTPNNGYLEHPLQFSEALGIPYESWSAEKLRATFPSWDFSSFGPPVISDDPDFGTTSDQPLEAVFFPCGGYCPDPQFAARNLQRAAESRGAQFRFNVSVSEIYQANNRISGVRLSNGETIDCHIVVNAAGPYSQAVIAMAGLSDRQNILTRVVRHQTVHINCPDAKTVDASRIMLYDTDVGSYIRDDTGTHILLGSLGAKGEKEDAADPTRFDRNLSPEAIEPLYRLAQRIPSIGIPNTLAGVADLWDVSDDWIPVYDQTNLGGFYLAIGTSGNQFKTAPAVGALMAALIQACEDGVDHDANPVQYTLPYTGHDINLGFFSRNREPNPASSLSVLG